MYWYTVIPAASAARRRASVLFLPASFLYVPTSGSNRITSAIPRMTSSTSASPSLPLSNSLISPNLFFDIALMRVADADAAD